ncbi:MAG: hypothetical protein ACK559_01735, partial [bacterium]
MFEAVVQQSYDMIFPIGILAIMIWSYIEFIGNPARNKEILGFAHILYYDENGNHSVHTKIIGGMINGSLVLLATLVLT